MTSETHPWIMYIQIEQVPSIDIDNNGTLRSSSLLLFVVLVNSLVCSVNISYICSISRVHGSCMALVAVQAAPQQSGWDLRKRVTSKVAQVRLNCMYLVN